MIRDVMSTQIYSASSYITIKHVIQLHMYLIGKAWTNNKIIIALVARGTDDY